MWHSSVKLLSISSKQAIVLRYTRWELRIIIMFTSSQYGNVLPGDDADSSNESMRSRIKMRWKWAQERLQVSWISNTTPVVATECSSMRKLSSLLKQLNYGSNILCTEYEFICEITVSLVRNVVISILTELYVLRLVWSQVQFYLFTYRVYVV